jgi:hypothetical protein
MSDRETQKCYSVDEEDFGLGSIGEVIDRIESDLPEGETVLGKKYWEADAVPILHRHIISDDYIVRFLETLDEQLDEFIEEPDSVYVDVPRGAISELKDIVLTWANKHVTEGRYYKVEKVQELCIELGDIETI